jgi:predicted metal-dependent hydrolase
MTPRRTGDIEYMLLRSGSRRTADIVIERDGKISVRVPRHLAVEQVDQLIEAKRYWIYKNLAEWRDLNATRVVRELRNGEGFMYLGSSYRLLLVQDQKEPLSLKDGRLRLRRDLIEKGDVSAVQSAFREYYIARGLERIEKRVAYYAPKVGVPTKTVTVKDLGFRWASCGKDGLLSFHWKCMMAQPKIIDYIVVHELCHLHQRDHTEAFWNEVDKVMPDYYERKAWLRTKGAGLDL